MKTAVHPLRFIVFVCLLITGFTPPASAGNETGFAGPRAFSCGQVSSLFRDVWSADNNPGALGYLNRNAAAVSFERRFSSFSLLSFSMAGRHDKWGSFGLTASRFGPDFFNQNRTGISWGKSFGIAAIGLQGQWYQVSAANLPARHYFLLNFGGLARLGEKLLFSGYIGNLSQTKSSDYTDQILPTQLKAGLAFQPGSNLQLMLEIQKDLDEKAGVNAGVEYRFSKGAFARTGFSSASGSGSLGFGLLWRDLQIDFGSAWHPELGLSHCIGLQYLFGKNHSENQNKP